MIFLLFPWKQRLRQPRSCRFGSPALFGPSPPAGRQVQGRARKTSQGSRGLSRCPGLEIRENMAKEHRGPSLGSSWIKEALSLNRKVKRKPEGQRVGPPSIAHKGQLGLGTGKHGHTSPTSDRECLVHFILPVTCGVAAVPCFYKGMTLSTMKSHGRLLGLG
jgi:hypothetical protein